MIDTLLVKRRVLNGEDIEAWARAQGFESMLQLDDLHVTVAFSREPVDWGRLRPNSDNLRILNGTRSIEAFGPEKDAIVLEFESDRLESDWQKFRSAGASWDFPNYRPHITLSYSGMPGGEVVPYDGVIELGGEEFDTVGENWKEEIDEEALKGEPDMADLHIDVVEGAKKKKKKPYELNKNIEVFKIDEDQRMVYGWASVITKDGEPVVDLQDDIIEPHELENATTEFMMDVRHAMAMHERDENGEIQDGMIKGLVVHSFPLTDEIAKALGISSDYEGWIVGVKVADDEVWKSIKDGTFSGFSIGAAAIRELV